MGIRSSVCALTVLGLTAFSPLTARAQETSVTFYETLSPHGDWVVVESYGRVWRPHRHIVGVDFVPYASGGHWVHTNVGWVFEPSWSWGWLPFHYGRWYQDPFNGWVWVPDNVWAPSWVEWRVGGGYIGWAPSPPRHHRHVHSQWYFVENRHFAEREIWHHRAVSANHDRVYESTRPTPPSGHAWAAGPAVQEVRAATQREIPQRTIQAPPPKPLQIFPRDLPAPAPVAPASPPPSGVQRAPPSRDLLPPPQPMQPQPMQREPPPMMQPQPMQPRPTQQPPMQREPIQAPPSMQRNPSQYPPPPMQQPPAQRMPQPMPQRAPQPIQQQPIQQQPIQQQPMQRAPEPMPMQREPQPMQQQPMQREPQPMQPMPAPMPQQQQQPAPQRRPQPAPAPAPAPAPMGQPFNPTPLDAPPPGSPR